jgi:hypothetical protein
LNKKIKCLSFYRTKDIQIFSLTNFWLLLLFFIIYSHLSFIIQEFYLDFQDSLII